MSYIGNAPISAAFLTDTFSGTGSQTAYTMTVAPANTSSIIVAVTGVLQDPSTYSVSGTTLTFSAAPPSGTSNISVRYLGIPASGVTTTAYRTVTNFTATAGQTSFSVPSYTVGYIDVYRNGVRLVSTDYTATTGTTVVLANACTVGDAVVTESFLVSSVLNAIPATAGAISLTSATYLSGILPVAYGGTGLTTVPHTVQVFTSGSGTYTTPANCKAILVQLVGGGGGGGGGANTTYFTGGGGGGSGGYVQKLINSPSATYSYGVAATAAGGAAGATGATGTAGANTTFSTFTASGGSAGTGGTGSNGFGGSGGAGGAASGGDVNIAGSDGSAGGPGVNGVVGGPGGSGGTAVFGGSGSGGVNGAGSSGKTNSGSGGGGGSNGAAGSGAAGIIIVTEYYV